MTCEVADYIGRSLAEAGRSPRSTRDLRNRLPGYDRGMYQPGRHFLQIPGPTNVPDRVLRAMAQPTIDHRGAEFGALGREVLEGLKSVFQTAGPVVIYPASGTGAWEAALVNTLSPGDRVLAFEIGEFARSWAEVARRMGLDVEVDRQDWRRGVDPAVVEAAFAATIAAPHPRPARRPQRDVDRRHHAPGRGAAGDRPRRTSRAAARRCGVVAGVDRSPPRRVGSRRHARRIAEGADAAARPQLQRDQRQGAGGVAVRAAAALVLGVGHDAGDERGRVLPLHAGDESALRPARGAGDAEAKKGSPQVFARHLRLADATRRRCAPGASRSPASGPTSTAPS